MLHFLTFQAKAEDTSALEKKLATAELYECIYYWAYASIVWESSRQEISRFIHEECKDKIDRIDGLYPEGVPKSAGKDRTPSKMSDFHIDIILDTDYEKALKEHKQMYRRR
jgi:hypothetical protein